MVVRLIVQTLLWFGGLKGYDEYAARVPYRLIPLVW